MGYALEEERIPYEPSSVPAQFHACDDYVRGLLGPLGSGKTVTCVMELFIRAAQQKPFRGVRRTRWVVIRSCYDDKTEILSDRGWVFFKDLEDGDKVAMLKDGQMVFVEPTKHYEYDYVGEMMGFEGEGVDFLVTPEHNMYVSKQYGRAHNWKPYEIKKAQDIYGKHRYRVKRDTDWVGVDTGWTVDQYEWFGFWFAEGYVNRLPSEDGYTRRKIATIQQKPHMIPYVKDLHERAGVPCNIKIDKTGKYTFSTVTKIWSDCIGNRIYDVLKDCGNQPIRRVPRFLMEASPEHMRAFIHGFMQGDGTYGSSACAWTSSKGLADDLQEIALKAGMVANINVRTDQVGKSKMYNGVEIVTNHPSYCLTFLKDIKHEPHLWKSASQNSHYKGWYKEQYSGKVYCVEVPTHVVYVRRNNKAFWCSQSYPELLSTTIKSFQDWIPPEICKFKWDAPITATVSCVAQDGIAIEAEFVFLALDRPEDIKKLKGLEVTGAWLNEASELHPSILSMCTGRVGRYPSLANGGCTWRGIIMDTNSPDDDHWYYKMAELDKPQIKMEDGSILKYTFFRYPPALLKTSQGYVPNPDADYARIHPLGYDYWLQQVPGKSDDWINVYILGNYGTTMDGKPVYPEWQDHVHMAKEVLEPMRGLPIYLGWDFGLQVAVVFGQITPRGQLRIFDELCAESMGVREFVRDVVRPHINNNYQGMLVHSYGDPAGTQRSQVNAELTCMKELELAGIPTEPCDTNDFVTRREAVAGFLNKMSDGEPGFLLSPKCDMLRKGFNGRYKYERVRASGEDRYKDKPVKNAWSHPHDGLQYLCRGIERQYETPKGRLRQVQKKPMSAWT